MGLNKRGLYNGVKPPEEGDQKDIKEKQWGKITVALGRTPSENNHFIHEPTPQTPLETTNLPKIYSSDLNLSFDYVFYSPRTNS